MERKRIHLPWLIVLALFVAALFSCTPEDNIRQTIPDSYRQIVLAHQDGRFYVKAEKASGDIILFFSGGNKVKVSKSDFIVSNCSFKEPSILEVRGDRWYIDGVDSGVPHTPGTELESCIPVYAYYTKDYFCLTASNAESIYFYKDESNPLQSFCFLKRYNPALEEDLYLTIDGDQVTGATHLKAQDLVLIPTFSHIGDYVCIDGVEQTSSVSAVDFSKSVTYSVIKHNGEAVNYTVVLGHLPILPIVRIETVNHAPVTSKTTYVQGHIRFEDPDGIYSSVEELELDMNIRGRGNSTWNMPKKPYRIKLSGSSAVFGMPADKDWNLLAEYSDKSLMRNSTAMELSRICEMAWTPQMRSVNLYFNGSYKGVYSLCEHKEVSSHKVDINVVTASDNEGEAVTGDYYLEIESAQDGICNFYTEVGIPIVFSDPEEPTVQQEAYIKNYLSAFEAALYSDSFTDAQTGYAAYVDLESFVKHYIIQELTKNIDGNLAKSCYLVKSRGGKLMFYHVWDFDIALGNCNYIDSAFPGATNTPEGWFIRDYILKGKSDGWYGRMFKDPAFVAELKAIWTRIYPSLLTVPTFIDRSVDGLYEAQDDNFKVWFILGVQVWPNYKVFNTYNEEVQYLKSFYVQRLSWMNTQIAQL